MKPGSKKVLLRTQTSDIGKIMSVSQEVVQVQVQIRKKVPGLGVQLLTAGTAACIADIFTFPLDTVKVRLQVRQLK